MFDRRRRRRVAGFVLVTAAATLAAATSRAQTTLTEQQLEQGGLQPPSQGPWDVSLGVGVAGMPTYDGAKNYRAQPVPLVSIRYRDLIFLGPGGLGVNVVHWGGLRMGPVIGYGGGRRQSDDPHLSGLGDIQAAVTAGAFANYTVGHWVVAGTVRQAVTHTDDGLLGNVRLDYRQVLVPGKVYLMAGPELGFANGRYERTYFGVTPAQSASSGLPEFTPHGGLKEVGLNFGLTYRWSQHVLLRSFGGVRELVDDTGSSPVVQSRTQGFLGVGAAYHF
ncbi:MAG TPA: MipA/OmpV family protein [Stellaceae bacterium]|nr:MipA/OmpV family protein [Stellaceae bacterium]